MLNLSQGCQLSLETQPTLRLEQLAALFDANPITVVVTGIDGLIRYINPAGCRSFELQAEQILGQPSSRLLSPLTPEPIYQSLQRALCRGDSWSGELCCRGSNHQANWQRAHLSVFQDEQGQLYSLALMEPLIERVDFESGYCIDPALDELTGLPNRLQLYSLLRDLLARTQPHQNVVLLSIDIYRFKQFNESLGHSAADLLLQAVAGRLKQRLNPVDQLCRLGGDQFMWLGASLTDKSDAWQLAATIHQDFSEPFDIEAERVFVGLSIGIAAYPEDGKDPLLLLKHADTALYRAKKQGRDRVAVFEPHLARQASERQQLENEFRYAQQRGELQLYYQPLINLNHEVEGAEAVLRWDNPRLGPVAPEQFVPLAEALGMIDAIGGWCLEQACLHLQGWRAERLGPEFVAVNVSPQQLSRRDFIDRIKDCLALHQLPPDALELEITEGSLLAHRQRAASRLDRLSRLGVRLSLDDFGTGYSALSYLQDLPFDTLKIDRSFVQSIPAGRGAKLVKAIVSMAQSLGLRLVAEGVERPEQIAFLQALGCDLLQGYHFTAPLAAGDFQNWVRQYRSNRQTAGPSGSHPQI